MIYLTNNYTMTALTHTDPVSAVYATLKSLGMPGDIYKQEDGNWEKYEPEGDTFTGDYSTTEDINRRFGLAAFDIDEDSRYKAALEHIQELESKLDSVQEAMGDRRAFERKLQEMLDAFSSEELLDAAFEDIDVDYQPFDPNEE